MWSICDIKYAHVRLKLFQIWIPQDTGNHQQELGANAWQTPFEAPAFHPSRGLTGDVHAETADIFQNTEDV